MIFFYSKLFSLVYLLATVAMASLCSIIFSNPGAGFNITITYEVYFMVIDKKVVIYKE